MKLFLASLLVLLLSSCAFHSGTTSSSISYNAADAEITDLVSASNSVTRILGIGGLDRDALILETKRKMYRQNPLKKGQMYANIGVDVKQAFYLIINVETVTVSADVLQFHKDTVEHQVFSKLKNERTSYDKAKKSATISPFTEGQSIYFVNKEKISIGTVQTILEDLIRVKDDKENSYYVDVSNSFHRIFFSDSTKLEQVNFQNKETSLQGYIVGYNNGSYVIKHGENLQVIKKNAILK